MQETTSRNPIDRIDINGITQIVIDARYLCKFFNIKKYQFHKWIKKYLRNFEENKDYKISFSWRNLKKGGRPFKDYYLSLPVLQEIQKGEK